MNTMNTNDKVIAHVAIGEADKTDSDVNHLTNQYVGTDVNTGFTAKVVMMDQSMKQPSFHSTGNTPPI